MASVPGLAQAISTPSPPPSPPRDPLIETATFSQLLEIDDEEHNFSRNLASQFVEQAKDTLRGIQESLRAHNLDAVIHHAFRLKGSAAAIGLARVQRSCERIHAVAQLRHPDGGSGTFDHETAILRCQPLITELSHELDEAQDWLQRFLRGEAVLSDAPGSFARP